MGAFKPYRGDDVAGYKRFEDARGLAIWARATWGKGMYHEGECLIPPGWTWEVLGWGDFSESHYMWEHVYNSKEEALDAFAKKFKLKPAPVEGVTPEAQPETQPKKAGCNEDGWCEAMRAVTAMAYDNRRFPFALHEMLYTDGSSGYVVTASYLKEVPKVVRGKEVPGKTVTKNQTIIINCCPFCGGDVHARFKSKEG